MKKIDLSIIIVSYNHEKYIEKAIDSVLSQKVNFSYELIFADDCSTDRTQEIIIKKSKKIKNKKIIFNKSNVGNTHNVINAYKESKGKYITCLEADDYWYDNNKLQTQYDFLENNSDYIAVSNKRFTIDKKGNKLLSYPLNLKKDTDISLNDFLNGKSFCYIETMFRNIFIDNVISEKFIELVLKDRMIGDLPLCIYLCDIGKVRVLANDFSVYRTITSGNNTNYNSKLNLLKVSKNHILILNRLSEYYNYNFSNLYAKHLLEAKIGSYLSKNHNEYKKIKRLIPQNNKHLKLKMIKFFPLFIRNAFIKIKCGRK